MNLLTQNQFSYSHTSYTFLLAQGKLFLISVIPTLASQHMTALIGVYLVCFYMLQLAGIHITFSVASYTLKDVFLLSLQLTSKLFIFSLPHKICLYCIWCINILQDIQTCFRRLVYRFRHPIHILAILNLISSDGMQYMQKINKYTHLHTCLHVCQPVYKMLLSTLKLLEISKENLQCGSMEATIAELCCYAGLLFSVLI